MSLKPSDALTEEDLAGLAETAEEGESAGNILVDMALSTEPNPSIGEVQEDYSTSRSLAHAIRGAMKAMNALLSSFGVGGLDGAMPAIGDLTLAGILSFTAGGGDAPAESEKDASTGTEGHPDDVDPEAFSVNGTDVRSYEPPGGTL